MSIKFLEILKDAVHLRSALLKSQTLGRIVRGREEAMRRNSKQVLQHGDTITEGYKVG